MPGRGQIVSLELNFEITSRKSSVVLYWSTLEKWKYVIDFLGGHQPIEIMLKNLRVINRIYLVDVLQEYLHGVLGIDLLASHDL